MTACVSCFVFGVSSEMESMAAPLAKNTEHQKPNTVF